MTFDNSLTFPRCTTALDCRHPGARLKYSQHYIYDQLRHNDPTQITSDSVQAGLGMSQNAFVLFKIQVMDTLASHQHCFLYDLTFEEMMALVQDTVDRAYTLLLKGGNVNDNEMYTRQALAVIIIQAYLYKLQAREGMEQMAGQVEIAGRVYHNIAARLFSPGALQTSPRHSFELRYRARPDMTCLPISNNYQPSLNFVRQTDLIAGRGGDDTAMGGSGRYFGQYNDETIPSGSCAIEFSTGAQRQYLTSLAPSRKRKVEDDCTNNRFKRRG